MMQIAFIGTGGIARQHARGLVKRDDVRFVGAFDVSASQARSFAQEYGGTPFTDMAEMLDATKPDAVWVCIPPFAHGEAEASVMARGIPFLVEKPISNSLDTARRVLDEVERTGVTTAVGFMNRYRRSVNRELELLSGDPAILAHAGWIGGTPGVAWWRVKAQSGGQHIEQTAHLFDQMRYLVGEPAVVCATATRGFVDDLPGYDVEDASTVAVQFENGAIGNLMSCCANRSSGGGVHLTIVAKQHVSTFTGWEQSVLVSKSPLESEQIRGEDNIFEVEDGAFVRAVATGDVALIRSSYADGLKTLLFCMAADRAMETGEAVQVASL